MRDKNRLLQVRKRACRGSAAKNKTLPRDLLCACVRVVLAGKKARRSLAHALPECR